MKILSNTENGGRVVEMTHNEIRELFLLMKTCDENVLDEHDATWNLYAMGDDRKQFSESVNGFDFAHLFDVVRAWRQAKFAVNKLQALVNDINSAIGGNKADEL